MESDIKKIVSTLYGLRAEKITRLDGYDNENYRIGTSSGDFVLKIYPETYESAEILENENEILIGLAREQPGLYPVPQKTIEGKFLVRSGRKEKRLIRLLSFLEGTCLGDSEYTPGMLYSFGQTLAGLDRFLQSYNNSAIRARRSAWDLQYFHLNQKKLALIENPADRKLVEYFFLQTEEFAAPFFAELRKSTIHGDANEWNVLAANGRISGIIDFGDLCYTPLINELAIALAYASLFVREPVTDLLPLVRGYHEVLPLEEKELELLYYLIPLRLCISVCHSADARRTKPGNKYALISEKRAWKVLRRWIRLNPLDVEDKFRRGTGRSSRVRRKIEKDLDVRQRQTSRALALQFDRPIKMYGAAFQYMYDCSGRTFLDCYNNIPQVGHSHPRVVAAARRAMARLNTNTRYLSDYFEDYAENLLEKFPAPLSKIFFVNSGSAAADLAIRLAQTHTGREGIVVVEHGYHGNTRLGIEISHYKYNRQGGSGKTDQIIEAEIPDTYKGRYAGDPDAGRKHAADLAKTISTTDLPVAALIAEPIVGCGGQVPLADDYLKNVYSLISELGGVCISDEVQTGFGRLGKHFWGFEMHGVIPDMVILGKPMGNGHPLAAVVTTPEIARSFETGMEFFSSFGGNTVSCAVGRAVLEILDEEDLPANAAAVGGNLLNMLEELVEEFEACGDARGAGLFLGLELVKNKESKKPDTRLASVVQNNLRETGILIGTDGPAANVLKIKPPLCFSRTNAEELVAGIDRILRSR